MKLVGGDSGRYERHTFVEDVLLSPSERAIIDVLFETAGDVHHRAQHTNAELHARRDQSSPMSRSTNRSSRQFEELRTCPDLTAERVRIDAHRDRPPDKTLAFESLMPLLYGDPSATADVVDVSDASRGGARRAGDVPGVRDEARSRAAPLSDVSDASRSDQASRARARVRDEARRRHARDDACPVAAAPGAVRSPATRRRMLTTRPMVWSGRT